ncbi:MAG: UDP-glucose dehydrogenase family protein [Candidatus Aminicenantia bacterium]
MHKITVIGAGYVGLVTAVGFAELGNEVINVEKAEEKLTLLKEGKPPFYEPGLEELLKKNFDERRLKFTDSIEEGVKGSDIIFICVGTPSLEDGSADLSQISIVAREIARYLDGWKLIVEKSTVPVKTSQWIRREIELYSRREGNFDVASNPEFLREGSALQDFFYPDRIVVGVESERAKETLLSLYKDFNCPIVITDINTAEIIKHASNSFLAMKISFINMISDLCEKTDADVEMVAYGVGLDKRIGLQFLKAGLGYGGSCFPKDVRAFYKIGEEHGLHFGLLRDTERINEQRIERLMEKVRKALWLPKDKVIGILGVAFKPNTDDIREAPSIKIIELLKREGAFLKIHDPKAIPNIKKVVPESERIKYLEDPYKTSEDAEALIIVTEWDEYRNLDLKKIKELMKTPIIIDGRNIYEPVEVIKLGFEYYCMGRSNYLKRKN